MNKETVKNIYDSTRTSTCAQWRVGIEKQDESMPTNKRYRLYDGETI